MRWAEFAAEAATLAERLQQEFEAAGVVLVGTVRRSGAPRVSPVEPAFLDGDLYLDMMWQSQKARDLIRDPRCEVHATPSDRLAPQFKVWGTAEETTSPDILDQYARYTKDQFDWTPYPQHHLFRLDLRGAAWISHSEDTSDGWMRVRTWRPGSYRERGPYAPPGSGDR